MRFGSCPCVLSTGCFLLLTVAAEGDKPNEQRPPVPAAGGTQSLHRCLLQRPAQRLHTGRRQDLRGFWKQEAPERTGIHLLCARSSRHVRQRKSSVSSSFCYFSARVSSYTFNSTSPVSFPAFMLSHASSLEVSVRKAMHVTWQRGLNSARLGIGSYLFRFHVLLWALVRRRLVKKENLKLQLAQETDPCCFGERNPLRP